MTYLIGELQGIGTSHDTLHESEGEGPMVSSWTMGITLWLVFGTYCFIAACAIFFSATRAYHQHRENIDRYVASGQSRRAAESQRNAEHPGEYGRLLPLHIVLPPLVGIAFGFILSYSPVFHRWVNDCINWDMAHVAGWVGTLLGAVIALSAYSMIIFIAILPLVITDKHKKAGRLRDYLYCLGAAFVVAFAVACF